MRRNSHSLLAAVSAALAAVLLIAGGRVRARQGGQ